MFVWVCVTVCTNLRTNDGGRKPARTGHQHRLPHRPAVRAARGDAQGAGPEAVPVVAGTHQHAHRAAQSGAMEVT